MSKNPPPIYLSSPHMGKLELQYIQQTFDTSSTAPTEENTKLFEQDICTFTQSQHCVAVSSGTAAIHLALLVLGIQPHDEVLVSAFTFAASANPIRYIGATPIFIESHHKTWNMSPTFLQQAIIDRIQKGKKPKAIIIVHIYGMPAHIEQLCAIAHQYQIPVIEDAAEAMGSTYNGKQIGTFGDLGIYSFNRNKLITTGNGGAIVSSSSSHIQQALYLATQAKKPAPHYQHTTVGYNYRISNIAAAIGRGQMQVIHQRIQRRKAINHYYKQQLAHNEQLQFLHPPNPLFQPTYWLTTLLIAPPTHQSIQPAKNRLIAALALQNIEARPLWKPMQLQPIFTTFPYYGDHRSDHWFQQGICLPSSSHLSNQQLDRVIKIIKSLHP